MIKLILVRHGETKWTEEKRYQGTTNTSLSKKGIAQSKKIANRLKKERIDIAYTSKLKRAIQTAQQIVKFHNIKLIKTKRLNERSYGKWESLTEDEVKERYPADYAKYKKEKYKTKPTKGESLFDLRKRIEPFIQTTIFHQSVIGGRGGICCAQEPPIDWWNIECQEPPPSKIQPKHAIGLRPVVLDKIIEENKNKTILIVSHNCPLRIIVGVLMGYSEEKIASLYFKLTSLTSIIVDNQKCSLDLIN